MEQPIIKVGILQNQQHANFTLKGNFLLNGKREVKNEKFSATAKGDKILLLKDKNVIGEYDEIKFTSSGKDEDTFEIENVIIGVEFHWEQTEVESFEGNLIIINRDEKLTLINEIPVEKYLQSVISSEMNAESPIEYLRAHSIISRSWLLAQINFSRTNKNRVHNFIETDEMKIKWYDREDH
ncbi:MAG: SpoIID/LytB domain-containing protein, partial [Ignavibacteria bacterium]|nr:SpoIID/LytB domain-containing protein [Ignavibacteria bacterium]